MKKVHFFIIYGCVCFVLIGGTFLYTYFKPGGIAEAIESRFKLSAVVDASLKNSIMIVSTWIGCLSQPI